MSLLDFDDKEILKSKGIMPADKPYYQRRREEDNFAELQNLGHKENSADFADSPFADRREEPKEYE